MSKMTETEIASGENREALLSYRETLVSAEGQAQSDYDRLIVALSGGALGVSFAFVDQFIGSVPAGAILALIVAWGCWVLSLALILGSHYFSVFAMRKAISQVDSKSLSKQAGGTFGTLVDWLNILAGISFLAGAILAGMFVFVNVRQL